MTQAIPDPPESLVAYQLRVMNDSLKGMSQKIDDLPEKYVTRREWEARNVVVNEQLTRRGRETGKLEARIDNASSNTRGNISLVIAALALVLTGIINFT